MRSVITSKGKCDTETGRRIVTVKDAFKKLKTVLRKMNIAVKKT